MKVKAKCARALIRYLKAKGNERENSNELCTTKLYYATCRQRVCGQNKDYLCLHTARTLIWRSCAFNRRPMTMPVLDGVKPMAITLLICGTSESLFWKRKKKHILLDSVETNLNIWRVRWPSPRQVRVQIPTSPRQVRDDRKTSRVRTIQNEEIHFSPFRSQYKNNNNNNNYYYQNFFYHCSLIKIYINSK